MQNIFRTPAIALSLNETTGAEKIQLFRVGTFTHPEYGKFQITPKMLADIKKNFDDKVRGVDLAIDYKHDNEDIAAGWIKTLELGEDGNSLFATPDWTPNGKKVVQEKEFRYISPEFSFSYTDNETLKEHGPTLLGAALTNRPFIKKMEPVQLSEIKYSEDEQKNIDAQKEADQKKILQSSKGEKKMGDLEQGGDLSAMKPEDLIKMINELKGKLSALQSEKESAMAEKKMSEKKAAFAKMLSEGKVCAAQEAPYLSGDMDKFTELHAPVKLSESGNSNSNTDDKSKSLEDAEDEIVRLAEEKLSNKKAKSIGEATSLVLSERKDLREKYENKFKN